MSCDVSSHATVGASDYNPTSPGCSSGHVNATPVSSPGIGIVRATPRRLTNTVGDVENRKKMLEFYNLIRNYKNDCGRELAVPFLELPSKLVNKSSAISSIFNVPITFRICTFTLLVYRASYILARLRFP